MASHLSSSAGISLAELPKSNSFTSKLPPDPAFETPEASHKAPRETLGPRMVKGALYTYVRPELSDQPELLCVSPRAMEDLGLKAGEEQTPQFKALVAGNEICWSEEKGGIYPWAQCYGGKFQCRTRLPYSHNNDGSLQVGNCKEATGMDATGVKLTSCSGQWAGQLGDGVCQATTIHTRNHPS